MATQSIENYKLRTKFLANGDITHDIDGLGQSWSIVRLIGEGANGQVNLQQEKETSWLRAVKRLQKDDFREMALESERKPGSRPSLQTLIKRELSHLIAVGAYRGLFVEFLGWYQDPQFVFITMEYIEGGDLAKYLKDFETQARENVKKITSQILEGLVVLHDRNICHRDLKPQNILIASRDPIWVKIADFGISKSTKDKLHTRVGTLGYIAPELLGLLPRGYPQNDEYTNAVDMWSMGCVVYEILNSKTPFEFEESDSSTMHFDTNPSCSGPTAFVNMDRLAEFCNGGEIDYPIGTEASQTSHGYVEFLERLLVGDPRVRMSAREARGHRWLAIA